MVSPGSKKGTTRFAFEPAGAVKEALLAGDFNDWQPTRMRRQGSGAFVLIVPLAAGEHQYKFVVDGEWVTDPGNESYAANPYGAFNSVASVAAAAQAHGSRRGSTASRAA